MNRILHHLSIIAFVLFLLPSMSLVAKTYVVVVDIQDYPGNESDFHFPVNNRQLVEDVLKKNVEDIVITSLVNEKATTENILKALRIAAYHATTEDALILYYSGHGYDGGFKSYDDYLSYEELRKVLKMCICNSKIVFADACHTGSLRSGKKRKDSGNKKWESNVMLFLSSRGEEESHYSSVFSASVFTHYLCLGLGGAADSNTDKCITAKELFDYVSVSVSNFMNGKQHPVMWGNFPADMIVIKLK